MTRVITDAESVEALAAEWPSVGAEDAIVRHYTDQVMQVVNDVPMDAARTQWGVDACEMLRDLVSERDALAVRVRELEAAVKGVLAWDEKRNFPIPYKVRDPLRAALTTPESKP